MDRDLIKLYLEANSKFLTPIDEPLDPECKIIVVVAAYNEADYIYALLNSFNNQREIDFNSFEVHILINNALGTDQEVVQNNQMTYGKILSYAKHSKYKLYAKDLFSVDKAIDTDKHSVGLIRDLGFAEAVYRFSTTERNGIIASTDADSQVSKYYIREILNLFKTNPDLIGYKGLVYYDRSEELQGGNKYWAYHELDAHFSTVIKNYIKTSVGDFKYKPRLNFKFAGSNSGALSVETALAGGIPHIKGREDVHFGYNLSKFGSVVEESKIIVYSSTRLEQRVGEGTGTGNKASRQINEALENGSLMVYALKDYVNSRKIELDWESVLGAKITEKELKKIFSVDKNAIFDSDTIDHLARKNPSIRSWEDISKDDPLRKIQLSLIEKIGKKQKIDIVLKDIVQDYETRFPNFMPLLASNISKTESEYLSKSNEKIAMLIKIARGIEKERSVSKDKIVSAVEKLSEELKLSDLDVDRFEHSRDLSFLMKALTESRSIEDTLKFLYFPTNEPFKTISHQKLYCLALIETQKGLVEQ